MKMTMVLVRPDDGGELAQRLLIRPGLQAGQESPISPFEPRRPA